ncbi:MAG: DUF4876 domain-containing protein [Bacteroidota bacterium]
MKQIKYLFLITILLGALASCKKDKSNDVTLLKLDVKTTFDDENATFGFGLDKAEVTVINLVTNQSTKATSNASGTATFNNLSPGNYKITVVLTVAAADYNAKAGTNVQEDIIYNGTISSQSITQNTQANVMLKVGRVGDFVIKQIYYAGSNAANGAIFRDQFFEIYNNSNETLYADSLYFAQVMGMSAASSGIDLSKGFYQSNGQYDWTKSVGMNNPKANTDYIYAKTMFMIPGTGKQYPLAPGKSIIIAATALNHQAPYIGATGNPITVKDPSLTIDLSKADFEVYLGDVPGVNPLASDLDMPAVTNVKVIDNGSGRDLIIDNLGRDGLVIFKTAADVTKWPAYATPDVTTITPTTRINTQIPVGVIIDGVGLQHAVTASRVPKRLIDVIDAGETFVPGGSYSSQSVVRKTSKVVNGRIVLKDTNNSTNDFGMLTKADPSKQPSSFIN